MRKATIALVALSLMGSMRCWAGHAEHWRASEEDPFAIEHTMPLTEEVDTLRQEVKGLQKLDLVGQMDALEQQVKRLQGTVEEQSHMIAQLRRAQTKPLAVHGVAKMDERVVYRQALMDLKKKKYSEATTGLTHLLAVAPRGHYAANAHYWLGEIALVKGHMNAAKQQFKAVETQFPKALKVSDALFKLAMIAEEEGHMPASKALYKKVIARDGRSAVARLARRALAQASTAQQRQRA